MGFKGKTAIVTGGASGIGKALCEALAHAGARVVIADVNAAGAQQVAADLRAEGGQASGAGLDVSDGDAVRAVVEDAVAAHGRLDLMFNNAGVGIAAELGDIDLDRWRRILDINLMGVVHGVDAAYRVMARQGSGHIVNTSSLAGLVGMPTSVPYATSKAGIVGLSMSLRAEAARAGVKVSVVCPGFVRTAFYDDATVVNADRKQVWSLVPVKMMDVHAAASVFLRGVERNKPLIVFPFAARLAWWLYRIHPALMAPFNRKIARGFHALRDQAPAENEDGP